MDQEGKSYSDKEPPLPSPNFIRDETLTSNLPPESMAKEFEEAPWKQNSELPPAVKKHPSGAQTAFRKAFNNALQHYKDETTAFKVAWSVLQKHTKNKGSD